MGELLNNFLLKNKKNENTISKSLYKMLSTVEEEIIKRKNAVIEAETNIKNNSINVKAISEATRISRKTFYNNELLNSFVLENIPSENTIKKENEHLKEIIKDYKDKINEMTDRDAIIIDGINENKKLKAELEHAYDRVKVLEKQHELDLQKINKLSKGISNNSNTWS